MLLSEAGVDPSIPVADRLLVRQRHEREFHRWMNSFVTFSTAGGFMYLNMKTKISLVKNSKITAGLLGATSVVATYFVWRAVILGLQIMQILDEEWRAWLS